MRIVRMLILGAGAMGALGGCTKEESTEANTPHATSAVDDHPVHEESGPAPTDKRGSTLQKQPPLNGPLLPQVMNDGGTRRVLLPPPGNSNELPTK